MSDQILVVDDNAATRYSVRRVLEHYEYSVVEAETASQGLASIKAGDFDAVVLDVNLPDFSGFELVRQLRGDPLHQRLPVVHVSAASMQAGDMVTGLEAGADAYLIHPVDPGVLVATLRTLLRARSAEEALVESESRMREIFSNLAAPISVLDARLRVVEANPAFGRAFALGGTRDLQLSDHLLHGQEVAVQAMQDAVQSNRRWAGVLVTATGREMEWRLTPHTLVGQSILFMQDVTEQRDRERLQKRKLDLATDQLEQEIAQRRQSESQLVQAQKMDALGQLTGGIAHDFNNQLTSIVSGIDVIEASLQAGRMDRVDRFIQIVRRASLGAAALTQRLLAFGRRQALAPLDFDVHAHVQSLEEMLRRTIGEKVELTLETGNLPVIAHADVNQFENVVLNLVLNARDAMPEGGRILIDSGVVELYGEREVADGAYARLAVTDNGAGMSDAVIEKVFEPFFTTKPIGHGTGLGLSMAYGFAKQSGGTISIKSQLGRGTRVEILVPLGREAIQSVRREATGHFPTGNQQRILLVDDNALLRDVALDMMVGAGYLVTPAADGELALRLLEGPEPFDLLVTDVGLPRLSGRALADKVRERKLDMPILFITGYAADSFDQPFALDHQTALLPKPFSMLELLSKVDTLLRTAQEGSAGV
jgi:signal transduction histidine kinase